MANLFNSKKINLFLYTLVVLISSSCNNNTERRNFENNNDSLVSIWKKDSMGCLHLRNFEMAEKIFSQYKLKDKSPEYITKLLGNPNKIVKTSSETRYIFFYNSSCNAKTNIAIDSMVWRIEFYFDKGVCTIGYKTN